LAAVDLGSDHRGDSHGSAPLGGAGALADLGPGPVHHLRRRLDGLDDVHVAGASAKVALEALADFVLSRVWVLREQGGGGHAEARGAVAALKPVLVPEGLLQRMELTIPGHALDRCQLPALGLDREHRAALHRVAVDEDGARSALARVAADVSAGKAYDVPQVMHEQEARLGPVLRAAGRVREGGP